jgi:predicted Fe-S protein YdhL (DUF1289 family)
MNKEQASRRVEPVETVWQQMTDEQRQRVIAILVQMLLEQVREVGDENGE